MRSQNLLRQENTTLDIGVSNTHTTMLPIELHRHFGAGMTPEIISHLAQKNGVEQISDRKGCLIDGFDPRFPEDVLSYYKEVMAAIERASIWDAFALFINSTALPINVIRTCDDLEWATYEQIGYLARCGMLHVELRVSPFSYARNIFSRKDARSIKVEDIEAIIAAIYNGLVRGMSIFGVSASLIVGCSKQNALIEGSRIVTAILNANYPLAFDLAGFEQSFSPLHYVSLTKRLSDAHIPITIHVGEQGTPPYYTECPAHLIEDTVKLLGAKRIGHGLSAATSTMVQSFLRETGTCLECCPLSNIALHFATRNAYPLKEFLSNGVRATISTDDPLVFGTPTVDVMLVQCQEFLHLNSDFLHTLTLNAIEGAFIDKSNKQALLSRYLRFRNDGASST